MKDRHNFQHFRLMKRFLITGIIALFGFMAAPGFNTVLAVPDAVDDAAIKLELRRQLIENDMISSHLIDIEVNNGVVTLSGTVDHLLARDLAEETAASMKGVQKIENRLIARPVIRNDGDIQDDVIDALAVDPATESYEITVSVDRGVVDLDGQVESLAESNIATKVAKSVKGVVGVVNDISVDFDSSRSAEEIKAEIVRSLELNPTLKEGQIDVKVEGATVTLSGTVGSLTEKREATLEAWTAGVRKVNNNALIIDWEEIANLIESEPDAFKTDAEIKEDVKDALLFDPEVLSTRVNVDVENAVVTLTGTVDSYNAKRIAEQNAEKILGVRRVKNYLLVRFDPVPSDENIEATVRDALIRDPIVDLSTLKVDVRNQKVYLNGFVDSLVEKEHAENVVSRVMNVADVENNITVNDTWTWKSDLAIREDILNELFWSPFTDEEDIVVTVNNGKATLKGSVSNWNEHSAAVENAFEGGAATVTSYLEVTGFPGVEDYERTYQYSSFFD